MPSPSAPNDVAPQQRTAPRGVTAQECEPPTATDGGSASTTPATSAMRCTVPALPLRRTTRPPGPTLTSAEFEIVRPAAKFTVEAFGSGPPGNAVTYPLL